MLLDSRGNADDRGSERIVDGRYEMAIGVCGEERITRVQVYERGNGGAPEFDTLRWDAKRTTDGLVPPNVIVIGDDGTFGYTSAADLRLPLPEEMVVVVTTTENQIYAKADLSDFKEAEADEWWESGESVPLSEVEHPGCS